MAALDALTFLLAAAMVAQLRLRDPSPPAARERWRPALAAGARHIHRTPALLELLLAATAAMAVSGVGVAAQYSLVAALGQRPSFLGVLAAALGAGSIAASLVSGRVVSAWGERRLALAGLLDFAVGTSLRASGVLSAAIAGSLVLGFALPWVFLAVLSAAQRLTPHPLQGRVAAAVVLALFGPQAPMQALGALAIGVLSYRQLYVGSAAMAGLLAAWLWRRGAPRAARAEAAR